MDFGGPQKLLEGWRARASPLSVFLAMPCMMIGTPDTREEPPSDHGLFKTSGHNWMIFRTVIDLLRSRG